LTLGLGLQVTLQRVARLLRDAGIQGLYRRRRHGCTVRDPTAELSGDLVNRQFTVEGPNRLWVTDITEHPTMEGKVYCAAVMDAYSRLIVGWSLAEHMRTELVTDALARGHHPSSTRETTRQRANHTTFRPRLVIHVLGVRETPARRRVTRLDGYRRRLPLNRLIARRLESDKSASISRLRGIIRGRRTNQSSIGRIMLRQRHDGIILGRDATRTTRHESMADPRRACQRHLRVERMLVQSEKTPFQHWNAQSRHLRDPPHQVRSRSLTPHRRCPCYGGNLRTVLGMPVDRPLRPCRAAFPLLVPDPDALSDPPSRQTDCGGPRALPCRCWLVRRRAEGRGAFLPPDHR
jgi:hypothetical protein